MDTHKKTTQGAWAEAGTSAAGSRPSTFCRCAFGRRRQRKWIFGWN